MSGMAKLKRCGRIMMKTDKARKTQRDGLKEDTKSPGLSKKDIGPGLTQLKECH